MSEVIDLDDELYEYGIDPNKIKGVKRAAKRRIVAKGTARMRVSGRNMVRVEKDIARKKEKKYCEDSGT